MAYIVHLMKNGQGNIESQKFKVITKFVSQKYLERFTKFLNHETLYVYLKGREPEWTNPKSSTGNYMNCAKMQ